MKTEKIRGFNDFVGEDALKRAKVRKIIEEQFEVYGFEPAETPIIEAEDFVKSENEGDEAVSDVFKLQDKGKRKLALRYEFTFQLKRIAKQKKLPYKRYQTGPVFRDEPVSSTRFRQFTQCDVDVVGSSVKDEVEVLATIKSISEKLGIDTIIYINNRKLMNEILEDEKIEERYMEDVIREIDKLDKLPEKKVLENLKKYNAEKLLRIFKKPEKFFEKYNFYKDIQELRKFCQNYGVKVEFAPSLARGLSYYNGTIFEAKVKGTGESVAGGGAFEINGIQSVGYGAGLERLCALAKVELEGVKILVLSIGQDKKAIQIAEKLRKDGTATVVLLDKGVSKALDYANARKIEKVVFVGEEEVKKGKLKVKDMKTGNERLVSEKELAGDL
ncbi:hypothetical protein CMI37_35320 [Candidatus Pacearchaeota archaeon]|nr:hypothetical protein [Candidatus Pacearchaeota archaeon]|tara:strand:- start:4377 stop:5537 length:1161 start_codon:yes stop_codon:yes gene_type:complete